MLKLTVLLIDMERFKGCLPYRYLHVYDKEEADAIICNSLMKVFSCDNVSTGTGARSNSRHSTTNTEEEEEEEDSMRYIILKRTGPVGHFQYIEDMTTNTACFSKDMLPDVFKSLWGV